MTYLSTDSLSKSYGMTPLFQGLTFGISKGDKTALIARNGTGKSTLLQILAGREVPDSGEVMVQNGIRIGFLEQEPALAESMTISGFISQGSSGMVQIIQAYEKAVEDQAQDYTPETQAAFDEASTAMEAANAWDYEQRMQQILGILNIHDLDQPIATLSGGERKRVALAFVLLDKPDLLILDEPTNHLDVAMIEWLEAFLVKENVTLLMVTHDRYFLDRVCNHILELDGSNLYRHKGNYEYFLQKRAEREEVEQTETAKAGQLLKKELAWMRRGPKARTSKSKSRISAFYKTKERAEDVRENQEIRLESSMARMGKQVFEVKKISKRFDDLVILDDFSYSFSKGERIGIIGRNGVGKSTFLNIITGEVEVDSGEVKKGETIVFGHYRQQGLDIDDGRRVIDILKDVAEMITLSDGKRISASRFLEHFMFTAEMQYTYASKLSGGEKRRLGLMMTLLKAPNFLILDEPTNDLDLITLQKLEEFLMNFGGCLILVSHDRFFMDKLTDHYFVFEGDGIIRSHHGTYSEYLEMVAEEEQERKREKKSGQGSVTSSGSGGKSSGGLASGSKSTGDSGAAVETTRSSSGSDSVAISAPLSYSEKKEYKKLEREITRLEEEKRMVAEKMNSGIHDYKELEEISLSYRNLDKKIEEKTLRWMALAERA